VKIIRNILTLLVAGVLPAGALAGTAQVYHLEDFLGKWALVTNQDSTIIATEAAIQRNGAEVFQRVWLLKVVASRPELAKHTEADIRRFITGYQPPAKPYTSESAAKRTGQEKFNCLEFAEDIVASAGSNGITAEVIGIKFEGKLIGHACAGFPTADGRMLYFDSTPGTGKISTGAHEAWVAAGEPYRRTDGGELAGGVGKLPVEKIIPVSQPVEIASGLLDTVNPAGLTDKTSLVVAGEGRVPANGIEYASPDTLQVSEAQLAKWNQAAAGMRVAQTKQRDASRGALQKAVEQSALKVLRENEALAARGDAYGQLRMGERYLTGDGVEKDLARAQNYLRQAADQGSPTAAAELKRLANQTK
jgi:hypothetical protein